MHRYTVSKQCGDEWRRPPPSTLPVYSTYAACGACWPLAGTITLEPNPMRVIATSSRWPALWIRACNTRRASSTCTAAQGPPPPPCHPARLNFVGQRSYLYESLLTFVIKKTPC